MLKLKFDRNSNKSGKDKIEEFTTHGVLITTNNNDFEKGLMISYGDTTDIIIIRILKDTKIQIINN
jgi:hypothetical protein